MNGELANYTPVPDDLVREFGVMTAAVWGRMWRYAQMSDGVCRASIKTIADSLGIARNTVIKSISILERAGLLQDITPDAIKSAHKYLVSLPKSSSKFDTVVSSSKNDTLNLAQNLIQTGSKNELDNGQSSSKFEHKESIDSIKKGVSPKSKNPPEKRPSTEHQIMFGALRRCCNVVRSRKDFDGWANRESKSLREAGFTINDIDRFKTWWDSDNWRKQKQPMSFKMFGEKFDAWVSMGKPNEYIENKGGNGHGKNGNGHNSVTWAKRDPTAGNDQLLEQIAAAQRAEGG